MSSMGDRSVLSGWAATWSVDSADKSTRKMFDLGARLRRESTAPIYDLSLGNPHLEPPPLWRPELIRMLETEPAGQHRYMPNAGFPHVREFVAAREGQRFGLPVTADDVVMTVGAAGAMAIAFRSVLDAGDEVVVPAPYFPEYQHYCRVVDAKLVAVATHRDFSLDVAALERALGPRTRMVILNSPNNPTGALYPKTDLVALADALRRASVSRDRVLYVLEDSPYRDLVYDGTMASSILPHYDDAIHISSHSKDLGLAGERIGFALVSPRSRGRALLQRALAFANRVLGFVSAPALMQRVLPLVLGRPGGRVDAGIYGANAAAFVPELRALGFEVVEPRGGLFLFPRVPEAWIRHFGDRAGDAVVERLAERRTLVVPGSAFGAPEYVRIALCVESQEIEGALSAFRAVCGEGAGGGTG
jgi:aspartate aminotransferase